MTEQQQIADAVLKLRAMPHGAYTKLRDIARTESLQLATNNHDLINLKSEGLIEFADNVIWKGRRHWRCTRLGAAVANRMGLV